MGVREEVRMLKIPPNRILEDRGRNSLWCKVDKLEGKTHPNAAAQEVEFVEPEMVHQSQMIFSVGMPAMIYCDIRARMAGISLIHGDGLEARCRESPRPVYPELRDTSIESVPHLDPGE
jgi:hypothetical protein